MNARLRVASIDLRAARDIATQALSGNAGPTDGDEVIDYALGQIYYALHALQRACRDGLEDEKLDVELIVLQERVEALRKFSEAFLKVEFLPLPTVGGEERAP